MSFAWPWLLALIPVPLIIRSAFSAIEIQSSSLQLPFYHRIAKLQNNSKMAVTGKNLKIWLSWLAWIFLVFALARPQVIGTPIPQQQNARDVMLAVDLSGSMRIRDMQLHGQPAMRLDVIKSLMAPFIERRKGDRIGLVLFGSQAFLQAPLTRDINTISTYLKTSQLGLAGGDTAIGDALALSLKHLKDSPAKSRVVILLTDGSNTAGAIKPRDILPIAKENQLKIHTIGLGSEQMIARSRALGSAQALDEALLKLLAEQTDGRYFRARNPQELEAIYQLLDQLEPIDADKLWFYPIRELFFYPLTLFMILLSCLIWLDRRNSHA